MILAGPTPTRPVADTRTQNRRTDEVFRKIAKDLAYGLTLSAFFTDGERVYIVAPNLVSEAKWEATYPDRQLSVDGHLVPVHICTEGDVEGGTR